MRQLYAVPIKEVSCLFFVTALCLLNDFTCC